MDPLDSSTSTAQPHVRKGMEQMNAAVAAQKSRARLMEASLKVRDESMRVNAEFDAIEDAPYV